MSKITNHEVNRRLEEKSNGMYHLVSDYNGRYKEITVFCDKHQLKFNKSYDTIMNHFTFCCPECKKEQILKQKEENERTTLVICWYCGKEFYKSNSSLKNSKSGLYFCCREHKDISQRIENNCIEIHPNHYNDGKASYRKIAFRNYSHECSNCKWDEDENILEVHHIDGNRQNSKLNNLIILCPTCHRKLTSGLYLLENQKIIKK